MFVAFLVGAAELDRQLLGQCYYNWVGRLFQQAMCADDGVLSPPMQPGLGSNYGSVFTASTNNSYTANG